MVTKNGKERIPQEINFQKYALGSPKFQKIHFDEKRTINQLQC